MRDTRTEFPVTHCVILVTQLKHSAKTKPLDRPCHHSRLVGGGHFFLNSILGSLNSSGMPGMPFGYQWVLPVGRRAAVLPQITGLMKALTFLCDLG